MIKSIAIILFTAAVATGSGLYNIMLPGSNDQLIRFADYSGKKILIVNTASTGNSTYQLSQLQQLYQQHSDSLVIVAFPSNSFGNEPRMGAVLNSYMKDSLGLTFAIAARSEVSGAYANEAFKWLSKKNQNEVSDNNVTTDFQKFLINRQGKLIGIFDSSVSPISTKMQDAVRMSGN